MTILKRIRKPQLAIIMTIIILFISCSNNPQEELISVNKFEYSLYENSKDYFLNLKPIHINQYNSRTNIYQAVLDYANRPFETPSLLENEALNLITLDVIDIQKIGLEKGFFKENDINLIEQLDKDIQSVNFDFALNNYQKNVLSLNCTSTEFPKYNEFVNVLMMTKSNYNKNISLQSRGGWACALAILTFTAAIVFVGSTCIPNPVTIYACPIAVARAAVAYASMIIACGGKK